MSNSFKELKGSSKDRSKRISMAMLDDSESDSKVSA